MTHDEIILLVYEVRELQKKYDSSRSSLVAEKLKKKVAILDNVVNQEMKPRNPQQKLFEAQ